MIILLKAAAIAALTVIAYLYAIIVLQLINKDK